jgi:SAM-dependent methyltransferase
LARQLSDELDIPAEFICSNLYELPQALEAEFDVVFTSYGVLPWLPDLVEWGKIIARFLAPGGYFYIAEQHPLSSVFSECGTELVASETYFDVGPIKETSDGYYADRSAILRNKTSYEWQHPLSDIINALIRAGLRVEFLHEFPFSLSQHLPSMVKGEDGWWHVPGREDLPFLFSLKASRQDHPLLA